MKRLINYFLLFTLIGSVTFTSCKKDDDTPNPDMLIAVSYTHLRAHETVLDLVCRLLLEKKNNT